MCSQLGDDLTWNEEWIKNILYRFEPYHPDNKTYVLYLFSKVKPD